MSAFKKKSQAYFEKVKRLPKWLRITIGMLLLIFGILGFLPVVGFWMIPLGLMVLAIDFKFAKKMLTKLKYHLRKLKRRWKKR